MFDLITFIPALSGMLVGVAGAVGAGVLSYGAMLWLSAPDDAWHARRGKTAMRYALLLLAVALAAFGAAELLLDAAAAPPLPAGAQPVLPTD